MRRLRKRLRGRTLRTAWAILSLALICVEAGAAPVRKKAPAAKPARVTRPAARAQAPAVVRRIVPPPPSRPLVVTPAAVRAELEPLAPPPSMESATRGKAKTSNWGWRISPGIGWAAWEDVGTLTSVSTNETGSIRSARSGIYGGFDLGWIYAKQLELGFDARAIWAGGSAYGVASTETYQTSLAPGLAATSTGYIRWYPGGEAVSIGLHGGSFFRWGSLPDGSSNQAISEVDSLPLTVMGELRWVIWRINTQLKVAYSPRAASAIWMLGGGWEF